MAILVLRAATESPDTSGIHASRIVILRISEKILIGTSDPNRLRTRRLFCFPILTLQQPSRIRPESIHRSISLSVFEHQNS